MSELLTCMYEMRAGREDCLALVTLRTCRLRGTGWFALALSPASGRHSHSLFETAALQGTSAKIEREREKLYHKIFLQGQNV